MALPSRKDAQTTPSPAPAKASARLASVMDQATPSPALQQQERLSAEWGAAAGKAGQPRWSHRRTIAFVALVCGGFWTCVALGIARLGH